METPEDLRRGFGVNKGGRERGVKICGGVQAAHRAKVPISADTRAEAEIWAQVYEQAKIDAAEARKRLRKRFPNRTKPPPPICGGAS